MTDYNLTIDFESFKKNTLENLFSSETSFIKEIAQNCERAGSEAVNITWLENERVMLIEDNGCGFDNNGWNKFFKMSSSGWSEDVVASQNPFGLGALAMLFSADEVGIWSKDKFCHFKSDELLNSIAAKRAHSEFYDGTMIALKIKESVNIKRVIHSITGGRQFSTIDKSIFCGFTIPVYFNNQEIDRKHALSEKDCYSFPDMKIIVSSEVSNRMRSSRAVYVQGLCIEHSSYPEFIIHLDSSKFTPKAPDRTSLVDHPSDLGEKITNNINIVRKDLIQKYIAKYGVERAVTTIWDAMCSFTPELLEFMPIPASCICTIDIPCYEMEDGEFSAPPFNNGQGKVLYPADVEGMEDIHRMPDIGDISSYTEPQPEDLHYIGLHNYFYLTSTPLVDTRFPRGHWMNQYIIEDECTPDLSTLTVTPHSNVKCLSELDKISYNCITVTICDYYEYRLETENGVYSVEVSNTAIADEDLTLIVPKGVGFIGDDEVRTVANLWTGKLEYFQLDHSTLENLNTIASKLLSCLRSKNKNELLENLLNQSAIDLKPILEGGNNRVVLDLSITDGKNPWDKPTVNVNNVSEISGSPEIRKSRKGSMKKANKDRPLPCPSSALYSKYLVFP